MGIKSLSFCLICIIFILLKSFSDIPHNQRIKPEDFILLTQENDPESTFASGRKLKLSALTRFNAESLPKVSDKIKDQLVNSKFKLLEEAKKYPYKDKYKSFESIKGIGKIKSKLLTDYLDYK